MNFEEQDVVEYRNRVIVDVNNDLFTNGYDAEYSFSKYVTEELEAADFISDYTPAFFSAMTGKKKCHINGYSYSQIDCFLNLFTVAFSGEEEIQQLGTKEIKCIVNETVNFISCRNDIKRYSSEATDYIDCIDIINHNIKPTETSIKKFRIHILTDSFVTDNAKRFKLESIEGIPVDVIVYDVKYLYEISNIGIDPGVVKIDFTKFAPWTISCVPAGRSSEPNRFRYESYIGVMPGTVLADIYDEFGAKLLEGNVRSFLSTKVAVNKKIRETLLRYPEQFFAFNNGISVTASNVKFGSDGNLLYAEEFQIINGGQTTASISNVRFIDKGKADLSKVNVLMKLTVTNDSMVEEDKQQLLVDISRASNQQNPVSDADFFSNHPFHVTMEKMSDQAPAPGTSLQTYWFYERARGQYIQRQMKMTKAQKEKFKKEYPPKQKITKTDFAKYRYSWEFRPHFVSKGAQSNFQTFANDISALWEKGEIEQAKFNIDYFKETVALAIMFNTVGEIVSSQDWYSGSFRANIVTYSIAMLHKLIEEQYPGMVLDLSLIWKSQSLPDSLKKVFKRLSWLVYSEIINERSGIVNFTQRCKQKKFWDEMPKYVSLNLASVDKIKPLLISVETYKQTQKKGAEIANLLKGAELQAMVVTKGVKFWLDVQSFAYQNPKVGMLDREVSALNWTIRGKIPTETQCNYLQQLLRRCQENGCNLELK